MIISHDRPLKRRINRFTKHYWFFAHVIDSHFNITDLNNSIGFSLLWINSRLQAVVEKELCPASDETGLTGQLGPV
jgi:hypothetical protein